MVGSKSTLFEYENEPLTKSNFCFPKYFNHSRNFMLANTENFLLFQNRKYFKIILICMISLSLLFREQEAKFSFSKIDEQLSISS